MRRISRVSRRIALWSAMVSAVLLFSACEDSAMSPTSPASATLSGTVVRGASASTLDLRSSEIGLVGVTVRAGSASTVTDGSGAFTLTGLPGGEVELQFERADIHARGRVVLAAGGRNTVTIAIVGGGIVASPRGHAGEEIEGLVQAIDGDGGTLTVLDQRLGAVSVVTDGSTLVRRGDTPISLPDIAVGNRVHVKALQQEDGSYLATEIILQSERVGGSRSVSGSVVSVDAVEQSFVVSSGAASVTVLTDGSTMFKRRGGRATFSDVTVGSSVEVRGTLQGDGSVLAQKVTIES
jgi:hypothetical protein